MFKRLMMVIGVMIVFGGMSEAAWAQNSPATSYQGKYYNVGATQPLQQTDTFQASAVTCNQTSPTVLNTVNPNRFIWDDPNNAGKICQFTIPTGGALQ